MNYFGLTARLGSVFLVAVSVFGAGCSGESDRNDDPNGSGNRSGSGGSAAGGRASIGGDTGRGGSAEGGTKNVGGSKSAGGTSASGGRTNGGSGGASVTGGRGNAVGGAAGGDGGSGAPATGGKESGGRSNSGGQGGSAGNTVDEYGFSYRNPGSREFSCDGKTVDLPDADWLCTFHLGDQVAYVYAQATAISVNCVLAAFGTYEVEVAQISVDGSVSPLAGAEYDWGGGHHNDSLAFDYEGKTYKYYHSSIGFGFRSCQPMDCLNVYEPGATVPETEGCSTERTLPEVCVAIKPGGAHDPLIDTFQRCPGDTG